MTEMIMLQVKSENQIKTNHKNATKGQLLIKKCASKTSSNNLLKEAQNSHLSSATSR